MAQTEESVLQAMYEHEVKKNESNSHEYVVRGATVKCGGSKKTCALNLPKDHAEYTVDKRPLITINDVNANNVRFGTCDLTGDTCVPSLSKWSYTGGNMKIKDSNTQKDEYTVTRYSTATCTKGQYSATVRFENSGQVIPDYTDIKIEGAIEIVEDVRKDWRWVDYNKDFVGHIKVDNPGVYNFGFHYMRPESSNYGGTVFLYKGEKAKFVGAYEIYDHGNEKHEGFEDYVLNLNDPSNNTLFYWTKWIDLVLDDATDYYIEVDCPTTTSFGYKFIGNIEKEELIKINDENKMMEDDKIGGIWIIDKNYKENYKSNFLMVGKTNRTGKKPGVPVIIFYLDSMARMLFSAIFDDSLNKTKSFISLGDISNVLSGISLAVNEKYPNLGIITSIIAFTFANFPKSFLNQLSEALNKQLSSTKITVYDCTDMVSNQPKLKYFLISEAFGDVVCGGGAVKVYGKKYLKGKFNIMEGYSSKTTMDALVMNYSKLLNEKLGLK